MGNENLPVAGPMAFLREAIQAVPAVKYALGVGVVVAVIAIVGGFGISYRVAVERIPYHTDSNGTSGGICQTCSS